MRLLKTLTKNFNLKQTQNLNFKGYDLDLKDCRDGP